MIMNLYEPDLGRATADEPQAAVAAGAGARRVDFVVERIEDAAVAAPRTQIEKSTFMVPR